MRKIHKECLQINTTFLKDNIHVESLSESLKENRVMKEQWIEDIMVRINSLIVIKRNLLLFLDQATKVLQLQKKITCPAHSALVN